MALPRSEEIKDLALKYSKQQLSGLAQRGEIDPMTAVMAGMMRDRIVSEEMRQNMPETTVADDILGAAQQMGQPQPVGQSQDQLAQMQRPVEGQPQMAMMAEGGLASIPFDDGMFDYAGGGIVAFSNGGGTFRPGQRGVFSSTFGPSSGMFSREDLISMLTLPELQKFNRTGELPDRLRDIVGNQAVGFRSSTERAVQPTAAQLDALETKAFETAIQPTDAQLSALETASRQSPLPPPGPKPEPAAVAAPAAPVLAAPTVPTAPAAPAQTDYLTRLQEMYRAAGVSAEPESAAAKELETDRKALDKSDKQANAMALIMAGLGIAGGESPYALVNLKGAIPALQQLGTDKKEINKLRRDYRKVETDLKLAADARKRGDVKTALDLEEKAGNRELKIREIMAKEAGLDIQRAGLDIQRAGVEAQRLAASKPTLFQEVTSALRSRDPAIRRAAETYLGAGKTGALTVEDALKIVKEMPQNLRATPQELMRQAQELVASQGAATRFQGFSARQLGQ